MEDLVLPEELGVCQFKDGSFECYPDLANTPPSTKYYRYDLVEAQQIEIKRLRDSLTEALNIAEQNIEDPDKVLIEHLKETLQQKDK